MSLKIRRGLEADRASFTPDEGELIYVTDTQLVYIGDGSTAGGILVTGSGSGSSFPIATAGGTADAITATFTPALTLTDKMLCAVVASGANTVTNPTFAPDGLTAHTIVKNGGQPLVAGDIPAALAVIILEYNLANTRWELVDVQGDTLVTAGALINSATSKATPVDADYVGLMDSAASNILKKLSWANVKATLKTYFDTLYAPASQLDTFTIPFSSLNFNPADSTTYYFAGANALAPAVTDTNYDSNFGYAFVIIGCTIGCYGNATQGSNENSVLQFRNVTQGTSTVIGNFTSDGTATMIQYTTMTGLNISVAATDWGCIQWDTPVWATNPGSVRTTGFLICKRV